MPITPASPSSTDGSTSAAPARDSAGQEQFLRLLMAQLGHQDPTAPMDSQAFVAQLAQFASVEQMQAVNGRLDALLVAQAAANQMQAGSLAGREVLVRSAELDHKGGEPEGLSLSTEKAATNVTVVVKDESGAVVRTIQLGTTAQGTARFTWDGLDDKGGPVPSGRYTVSATGTAADGSAVKVEVLRRIHVEAVSYVNGFPELVAGGQRFSMSDVAEISEAA